MPPSKILQRSELLRIARTWIGTPFDHQKHLKGVLCDCIGLIVETCREAGVEAEFEYPNYRPFGRNGEMMSHVRKHLLPVAPQDMLPADVAVFSWREEPTHLAWIGNYLHDGISMPLSLIHARNDPDIQAVTEHAWTPDWMQRFVGAFRLPGVT